MRVRRCVGVVLAVAVAAGCGPKEGPVVSAPRPSGVRISVLEFRTDGAYVNYDGPYDAFGLQLASEVAGELRRRGHAAEAIAAAATPPAGTMLVRGRIDRIDGGSRGARFWVGFGAGRSRFGATGEVVRPDGTVLASFRDERSSSGMADAWGGASRQLIQKCLQVLGDDIAEMIDTGQYHQ